MKLIKFAALSFAMSLSFADVAATETVYTGTGTYSVVRTLMPLGNGGAAVQIDNEVVLSIAPGDSGSLVGNCAGLGYISPAGDFTSTAYCNVREDAANSIDIKATRTATGLSGEVIGGRGKWHGATGGISINSKVDEADHGSFEFVMRVTTP
jgi:hypothetical protein